MNSGVSPLLVIVRQWKAWAPGLESQEDWQRWSAEPFPISPEGSPAGNFLPPLLRRRCSRLSKASLWVALGCCPPVEVSRVSSVFASRHGEIETTITLLGNLARGEALSPTQFSHSVHNTAAGHFSLVAHNEAPSTSLAGGRETFARAFGEALTMLHRYPQESVLLVVADEPMPAVFAPFVDEPQIPYALGLLLSKEGAGQPLSFAWGQEAGDEENPPFPQALLFLRWFLSQESQLVFSSPRWWRWQKRMA